MLDNDLLLLPAPERIEYHAGWCALPNESRSAWTTTVLDPTLPAQGYVLDIAPDGVRIRAADPAGMRYAQATLDQLISRFVTRIPTLTIHDQPRFAVRGVMLDVSRDRIPTMPEFRRIIAQLAAWKINHLQLYVEHTVAYAGHEAVWQGLDPLTPDELRALDEICIEHGIELAANQNCFGHLSGFLKHPAYQHLAEIAPDGTWDFNGLVTRTGPFSLCPGEPAATTFVADLLAQLCPLIRSPWVNIGCDETFDVGQGRSRAAVAERGRAAVYLEFLNVVCRLVTSHGKRPQFWADIALEHPEALDQLPPDALGLAWGYEGDARFHRWCEQLAAYGRSAWVCPGTSSWRSITGRTTERRANLLAATAAVSASGFLVTDWGDLGHRQQWPIALHGLAEAAHRAWSGTAAWDPRCAGLHAGGNPALGPWLDELGDADRELRLIGGKPKVDEAAETDEGDASRLPLRNATALFTDLHLETPYIGSIAQWQALDQRLAELALHQPLSNSLQVDHELRHTLAVARFACSRARARRGDDTIARQSLRPQLAEIIAQHQQLWLARSRAGGLAASCRHYEAIFTGLPS